MPTCAKCGNPRVDRFCSQCGTPVTPIRDKRKIVSVAELPEVRIVPRKPSRTPLKFVIFTCLLILCGIASLGIFFAHDTYPTAARSSISIGTELATYLRDFNMEAGNAVATAHHSLNRLATTSVIESRLTQAKADFAQAAGIRERLAAAFRQARLEDRWPVNVAGGRFYTPQQLMDAIESADVYLRRAATAEQELNRALEQNRGIQSYADGVTSEMEHIRDDGQAVANGQRPADMTSLSVQRNRLHALSAQLQEKLRYWTDVDWNRANLSSFQLAR